MPDNKNPEEDDILTETDHPERNDLSDEENVVQLVNTSPGNSAILE